MYSESIMFCEDNIKDSTSKKSGTIIAPGEIRITLVQEDLKCNENINTTSNKSNKPIYRKKKNIPQNIIDYIDQINVRFPTIETFTKQTAELEFTDEMLNNLEEDINTEDGNEYNRITKNNKEYIFNKKTLSNDIDRCLDFIASVGIENLDFHILRQMNCTVVDIIRHNLFLKIGKDRYGSRYLQSEIVYNKNNIRMISIISNELTVCGVELCINKHGNYIVQKFVNEMFNSNNIYYLDLCKNMLNNILSQDICTLCCSLYASRMLQNILMHQNKNNNNNYNNILLNIKLNILNNILNDNNNMLDILIKHNYGNHILQLLIPNIPKSSLDLLCKKLVNSNNNTNNNIVIYSLDKYGCRVLQKLLDYCDQNSIYLNKIYNIISNNTVLLSKNKYGNYVIQKVLDICKNKEILNKINNITCNHISELIFEKHSSNVIETILEYHFLKNKIINHIINHNSNLICQMAKDKYGNYILQSILTVCNNKQYEQIKNNLELNIDIKTINKFAWGKNLLNKLVRNDREENYNYNSTNTTNNSRYNRYNRYNYNSTYHY